MTTPWCSPDEWLHVYHCLKDDPARAIIFMENWKCRLGTETPIGILATLSVMVALREIEKSEDRNSTSVILCASGALTQSLGLLIERYRGENRPMHLVGRDLSIPDWVTNLRHRLAHGPGEMNITQLEQALIVVLESLVNCPNNYWKQQAAIYEGFLV